MFPQYMLPLLRRAGIEDLLTRRPLEAFVENNGVFHVTDTCVAIFGTPSMAFRTVAPAELGSACFCVHNDTNLYVSEVVRTQGILQKVHTRALKIQRAEQLTRFSSPHLIQSAYVGLETGAPHEHDLRWVDPGLSRFVEEQQNHLVTVVRPHLVAIAREALEASYDLQEIRSTLEKFYVRGSHAERSAMRTLLDFWVRTVSRGENIVERRRKLLAAVGAVAKDRNVSPRSLGLRTKSWLRDAERLWAEASSGPRPEQTYRLAVYGVGALDRRLEIRSFTLREEGGVTLVGIPDRARLALGREKVHPARCSTRPVSDKVVLEMASALWDPSLKEMFNDLDALVDAAEALR